MNSSPVIKQQKTSRIFESCIIGAFATFCTILIILTKILAAKTVNPLETDTLLVMSVITFVGCTLVGAAAGKGIYTVWKAPYKT